MDFSNYLANATINATTRGVPYAPPVKVWVALYTTDPTKDDTGLEVSGSGGTYAREELKLSMPGSKSLQYKPLAIVRQVGKSEILNVFKPFYRIDKSRNQNSTNSGLGLSTTKQLLNSINGTIELSDSQILGGLEVRIKIPN